MTNHSPGPSWLSAADPNPVSEVWGVLIIILVFLMVLSLARREGVAVWRMWKGWLGRRAAAANGGIQGGANSPDDDLAEIRATPMFRALDGAIEQRVVTAMAALAEDVRAEIVGVARAELESHRDAVAESLRAAIVEERVGQLDFTEITERVDGVERTVEEMERTVEENRKAVLSGHSPHRM